MLCQVFAIGVGSRVSMDELIMIAPKHHRRALHWDSLPKLSEWIAVDTCSGEMQLKEQSFDKKSFLTFDAHGVGLAF